MASGKYKCSVCKKSHLYEHLVKICPACVDALSSDDLVRLKDAIARYLANDGSHGCFDAMALADARRVLVDAVGIEAITDKQREPF